MNTPLCARCDAVCCRQTVVLQPGDRVPAHLTRHRDDGLLVMARDEDGWCVAIDGARMNCSIHPTRPGVCRAFEMGGRDCLLARQDYARRGANAFDAVPIR